MVRNLPMGFETFSWLGSRLGNIWFETSLWDLKRPEEVAAAYALQAFETSLWDLKL